MWSYIYCNDRGLEELPPLQPGVFYQTKLFLRNNHISSIKEGQLLPSLLTLGLNNNSLTSIPAAVCQLPHLTDLKLAYNLLTSIDADTLLPGSLVSLDAGFNNIAAVTAVMFRGHPYQNNLQRLLLFHNPLTSIAPGAFRYLKQLQLLDVSYTGLTRLPLALADLTSLDYLNLDNDLDLVCTCKESSLVTWSNSRPFNSRSLLGDCVVTSVIEFLQHVGRYCPAT